MKLLLTGATGFVGRNLLLREILEGRYDEVWVPVRSVDKLKSQLADDGFAQIPSRVRAIEASAGDWKLADAPKFDHVIHSAGVIFARTRQEYFDVNVDGTLNLFQGIARPSKAIILSSLSAAGPCLGKQVREECDQEAPVTWYGQSKLAMERALAEKLGDLPYLCLRPPMIFGPRDQATLPLFKMVKRPVFFKAGLRPKYYSFLSVFDLVSAIYAALDERANWDDLDSRHFFVASDQTISDRDLISAAAQASSRKGIFVPVPQSLLWGVSRVIDTIPTWRATIPSLSVDRAKEIWPDRWVVSSRAFQERFGWSAREALPQVIEKTREWYLRTGQLN